MANEPAQSGRVLLGRYRLVDKLGEGGMGTIWRAEHMVLRAPVAVKMIDRDVVNDEETKSRFIREAQAAAALRSPHVVQILDYGVHGRVPFIVMELLEGETLAQRLRRDKKLDRHETALIITHVARAIGRAHEAGIVHRDLKPENVFLVRNEDEEMAKVLDFGVAKMDRHSLGSEETRTRTGSLLGTPYYMSPEQAQGNKTIDHRSDLWSLAVIAFQCLTGRRPFVSDGLGDLVLQICVRDIPVPSMVASVPLGFDPWFARATQRDPELRFQSARELSDSLREALGINVPDPSVQQPDVLISTAASSLPPSTQPKPSDPDRTIAATAPNSYAKTVAVEPTPEGGDPVSRTSAPSHPEVQYPSTQATDTHPDPPGSRWSKELSELTLDQFSTTSHLDDLSERSSRMWVVILVAVSALVAGVVLGVVLLSRSKEDQAHRALPEVQPAAAKQAPTVPPTVPSGSAAVVELPKQEQAPQGADSGVAASLPAAGPQPGAPESASDAGAAVSDAAVDGAGAAQDSGWVKPAWAIPDDELPEPRTEPNQPPASQPRESEADREDERYGLE